MLVAISGLEGAGKTTAIRCIQAWFEKHYPNREIVIVREPGGTPMAEHIRTLHKSSTDEYISPKTELYMMYASRIQLFVNVIIPALKRGAIVISDRCWCCSYAYQIWGRSVSGVSDVVSEADFWQTHRVAIGGMPEYGLILFLDVEPAKGLFRAGRRGELDRIEMEQITFFERAREGYLHLAKCLPNMHVINANEDSSMVSQCINNKLDEVIPSLFMP